MCGSHETLNVWIVFFKKLEIFLKIPKICTDLRLDETPIFYISFLQLIERWIRPQNFPNIWWEWSRGLKIGSLKWFWWTCSCFHPCRCSNSQKTTFFQYNSLMLMHKNVWKTLRASCNQAVCVFPGISGPCERSRREKSCFIPIWVVSSLGQITVSWRWWVYATGQGVKPISNLFGSFSNGRDGHPPFAKLAVLFRTFLLWLCNYDIVCLEKCLKFLEGRDRGSVFL